jgi:hypothetical protein
MAVPAIVDTSKARCPTWPDDVMDLARGPPPKSCVGDRQSDSHHGTTGALSQSVGYVRAVKATNAELHAKGAGHGEIARFVGMDIHAETIAVAIAEGRSAPRSLGTISCPLVCWRAVAA